MEELRGFNLDKLYRKLFLPDAEFIASTPKKTDRADDPLQAREICFMGAESLLKCIQEQWSGEAEELRSAPG